ncbi:MAG: DUF4124 domain-containing protein [Pseudomonadales bacterium]|nr:DUF4124 domain-containing protein [Pseudomonadales bacterium]|tara:strand:+ start:1032 stop:1469 length:438 start_codon:yes stop_codon:yes gene_type:complete
MSHRKLPPPLLAALMLCSFNTQAQIYRWVDADGQVHFDQQPRAGAEVVEIRPQVVERERHVRDSEAAMERLTDIRAEERQQQRNLLAQQQRQRRARCADMRDRLARFEQRVYWYEENADGKRVEVSNARVAEAKASLRQQIAEQC